LQQEYEASADAAAERTKRERAEARQREGEVTVKRLEKDMQQASAAQRLAESRMEDARRERDEVADLRADADKALKASHTNNTTLEGEKVSFWPIFSAESQDS
jgi:hypothetical protein